MICSWCKKEFTVLYPDLWAYRVGKKKWFCTWKCLRADEKKGENEMPRMKKDGTPAKKPGQRKTKKSLLEEMPVNLERDRMVLEQLERKDKEGERIRQEMFGKPIHIKPPERFIKKDEYEKTIDDLETEVAAMINEDVPMTADERSEKWPIIPTRVETKNGTWEIIEGYKGMETLVGFRSKSVHEFGPLSDRGYVLVLTVSEWDALHDEMDRAMNMMKL